MTEQGAMMTPIQLQRAGQLIKQAARRYGSQQALAEAIGVHQTHVSGWINGKYPVSALVLESVYRATGIAPRDLRPDLADLFRFETSTKRAPEHV